MKNFLISLILNGLAVFLSAHFLNGVHVENFLTAIIVAFILSLFSSFLKPILVVLTFPITVLTLGLFLLVINVILIYFCAWLVPSFTVDGFFSALLFSFLLSFFQWLFNLSLRKK